MEMTNITATFQYEKKMLMKPIFFDTYLDIFNYIQLLKMVGLVKLGNETYNLFDIIFDIKMNNYIIILN